MGKHKIRAIFEVGDGREWGEHALAIGGNEAVRLFSDGWDCDDDGYIEVWHIPYIPVNDCEEGIAVRYLERCKVDCCNTVDVPKARLTKNRTFDIIEDAGIYMLKRCNGADVDVYQQKVNK